MATVTSEPELTEVPEDLTDLEKEMVGKIDSRLGELREVFGGPLAEYNRLAVTRQNLLAGENGTGMPSTASGGSQRRASSNRSAPTRSGGNRKGELLSVIKANPGVTVAEAAEKLGLGSANYLYRVRDELVQEGAVRKDGTSHYAVEAPAAAGAKAK